MCAKKKMRLLYVVILLFPTTTNIFADGLKNAWNGLRETVEGAVNFIGDYREGQNAIKELPVLKQTIKEKDANIQALTFKMAATQPSSPVTPPSPSPSGLSYGPRQVAAICAVCIAIGVGVDELYHWIFPTKEMVLKKELAKERLKLSDAQVKYFVVKTALNKCLGNNMRSVENDEDGLPIKCKDAARLFLEAVGPEELDRIKSEFKAR